MDHAYNELKDIPEIAFYNKLDYDVSDETEINHYLEGCPLCYNSSEAKNFVPQLVRNYENYKIHAGNNTYYKYCRFFKYWLYSKRNINFSIKGSLKQWDDCIFCVWKKLEKENDKYKEKCEFDNKYFSYAFIQVHKALYEICSIKEKLNNNSKENSDIEECSKINKIKQYYLEHILSNIGSITSTNSWNDEYFKINETCSLKNIYDFLQEKQCPPEVKAGYQESKVCQTPSPVLQQHCSPESCNNLKELCQEVYPPQACAIQSEIIQPESPTQTCENVEQICKTHCTKPPDFAHTSEEPSNSPYKNPHLQLPVTVFSSVVGTIFFFFFLYKFTPFRSWFLNRIGSKKTLKHKMKQEMDREFLGAPFQPPYRDDQNSRPRVGYSQN